MCGVQFEDFEANRSNTCKISIIQVIIVITSNNNEGHNDGKQELVCESACTDSLFIRPMPAAFAAPFEPQASQCVPRLPSSAPFPPPDDVYLLWMFSASLQQAPQTPSSFPTLTPATTTAAFGSLHRPTPASRLQPT